MKLEEVKKHFKLSRKSKHCVELKEAWEEKGYLYILSELCEKGNLDGYLVEMCQDNGLIDEGLLWELFF